MKRLDTKYKQIMARELKELGTISNTKLNEPEGKIFFSIILYCIE